MDLHRCRFVDYTPSSINVLAFSHTSITREKGNTETLKNLRLAIGRANGDIEIWNPLNGLWLQETILRGGKDRSVDGLVWIHDPDEEDAAGDIIAGKLRLFSVGYSTTVTEWDLEKGQPLRHSSGNHGDIWCLAAQPQLQKEGKIAAGQWSGQNLLTGCTDGAVVLYSTADDDLKLQKILVRPSSKKAKVISMVFQDRNIAVAGCTDSTIRIYDTRSGTLLRGVSLGAGPIGGPKEIIVWSVKCLPNGTIVSGDSTGEVRIWDGKTYTLVQRIKSHKQDVLSLATSADGSTIISGGMDRKTVVHKQVGARPRWAKISHNRFHGHDVKAMATFEGRGISVLASGGPDANPIIVPLREIGQEHQRMLPSLPQETMIRSAPAKRLLVSFWDREVHIWRLSRPAKPVKDTSESESEAEHETRHRKLVAKIAVKGEASITSASITPDGSILAVSTINEIKLFRLRNRAQADGEALRVLKINVPEKLAASGGKTIQLSPDGKWLCVSRNDNKIFTARITTTTGEITSVRVHGSLSKLERLGRKIEKRVLLGGLGAYDRSVSRIAFSSDSRILAVGDLAGYVDTWVLEGIEDLNQDSAEAEDSPSDSDESESEDEQASAFVFGQRWLRNPSATLLPKLPAAPVVLSFRPSTKGSKLLNGTSPHATRHNPHPHSHDLPNGEDRLMVVTANHQVLEFQALRGGLTSWSKKNPPTKFPLSFRAIRDQAMGCVWDVNGDNERLWLYGSSWLWMFDLSKDFPARSRPADETTALALTNGSSQKRKRRPSFAINGVNPKKNISGAGSKVPDHELTTGMSRKIQKVAHNGEDVEMTEANWNRGTQDHNHADDDDDDNDDSDVEEEPAKTTALDRLRLATAGAYPADEDEDGLTWHTFKYRPIMGVVPLSADGAALEVALVERPEWDLDLPPRYHGQEWEQPGI